MRAQGENPIFPGLWISHSIGEDSRDRFAMKSPKPDQLTLSLPTCPTAAGPQPPTGGAARAAPKHIPSLSQRQTGQSSPTLSRNEICSSDCAESSPDSGPVAAPSSPEPVASPCKEQPLSGSRSKALVSGPKRPGTTRRRTASQDQTAKAGRVEAPPSDREHEQKNSRPRGTKKLTKNLPPRGYHTPQELAAECGVSERTILREIHRKKLRANRFGRQYRIPHPDWQTYRAAMTLGT